MRSDVVKYLAPQPLAKLFQEQVEERFQGKWFLYLKYIEMDGSWGDPLTLLGLSHILRRPIRAVTDSHSQDAAEYTRVTWSSHAERRNISMQSKVLIAGL